LAGDIIPQADEPAFAAFAAAVFAGAGPGVRKRVSWLVGQFASTASPLSISSTSTL
jgi:hypothetical protein